MITTGRNGASAHNDETDILEHFFYFPQRLNADKAADRLRAKGWKVQVIRSTVEDNWLVFAVQRSPVEDELEKLWEELTGLAEEFDGNYDGWGRPG